MEATPPLGRCAPFASQWLVVPWERLLLGVFGHLLVLFFGSLLTIKYIDHVFNDQTLHYIASGPQIPRFFLKVG